MTVAMIVVAIVFVAVVVLFVTEVVSVDMTALLCAGALMVTGVLTPAEGLSGFSNPATVTIAAMLVLSAGLERTGALTVVSTTVEKLVQKRRRVGLFVLFTVIGVLSSFVNNTAVVAIFIPIIMELSPKLQTSPSKLLMPLSFVSIFGGVCTLIGTSTNLVVSSIAVSHDQPAIGMFELLPVGGVIFVVGTLYMMFIGTRLIPPRRETTELTTSFGIQPYLTDVVVGPLSNLVGRPLRRPLDADLDIDVLTVLRNGKTVRHGALLRVGDVLRVRASAADLARFSNEGDVRIGTARSWRDQDLATGEGELVEVVLSSDSEFVGESLKQADFRTRHRAVVLALRRRGRLRQACLGDTVLLGGDTLLLRIDRKDLPELSRADGLVVASSVVGPEVRHKRAPLAVGIIAAVVLATSLGLVPIVVSALIGALAMVLTGCLRIDEAYESINWRVVMLLAGVIPLGVAMENTGLATMTVDAVVGANVGAVNGRIIIAALYMLTLVMTNLMSNVATATLLAPLSLQLATLLGVDPRPLLITVTFAASLSFSTPIGYQTNTLIYGPGQYRFTDFLRVGPPLTLICGTIVTVLVPIIWPF